MKIRRYPGKAVDASLSLEQTNAMETIYKNNWLNAHEKIQSHIANGIGYCSDTQPNVPSNAYDNGVSSLGKYQMTLEQIRNLELRNQDPCITQAVKDLSGYRPSTLRRKNRRHYPGWDDLIEKSDQSPRDLESLNDNPNDYYKNSLNLLIKSETAPDTLRYGNVDGLAVSPPIINDNHNTQLRGSHIKLNRSQTMKEPNSSADFKDVYLKRVKSKLTSDKSYCDTASNAASSNSANSNNRNECNYLIEPFHQNEICDSRENISKNRMSGYVPIDGAQPVNRTKSLHSYNSSDAEKTLYDTESSVSKKKSYDQRQRNANDSFKSSLPSSPFSASSTASSPSSSPTQKFNTISSATKHRFVSIETNLNVMPNNNLQHKSHIQPLIPDVKLPRQATLVADLNAAAAAVAPSVTAAAVLSSTRRKPASSSSADSDELFSIPRPRLIVPVHTYARKRRTGNLINDRITSMRSSNGSDNDNEKGKKRVLAYLNMLFL